MQHNNSNSNDSDDDDERVVATDPTGRFEKYTASLGKGAYKEVFKAFDQENGVEVAWNTMRLDNFGKKDVQRILSEIQILESLRNENIINLYYSWMEKGKNDNKNHVIFITELMTSGTLKTYLRKTKGQIKPKVLKNWCRQILNGLCYLHTRDPPIIHRDLKCENIFINGNNGQAKIGDLGLAGFKSRDHMSSLLGTPEFMAPELYDEMYDEKVDVYAFGMVVLEIATKDYPYCECQNQAQIYKKVTSGIKPASLKKVTDPETKEFIELCIMSDKDQRPSVQQLLAHPFLTEAGSRNGPRMESATSLTDDSPNPSPRDTPRGSSSDKKLLKMNSQFGSYSDTQRTDSVQSSVPSPVMKPTMSQSSKQEPTVILKLPEPASNIPVAVKTLPVHNIAEDASRIVMDTTGPPSDSEVGIRMLYTSMDRSIRQDIKFTFNLTTDTATDVISELVAESLIDASDETNARRKLEEVVRKVLMNGRSSSNSTELYPQEKALFDAYKSFSLDRSAQAPAQPPQQFPPVADLNLKSISLPRSVSSSSLDEPLKQRSNTVTASTHRQHYQPSSPPLPMASYRMPGSPPKRRVSPNVSSHTQGASNTSEEASTLSSPISRPATPVAYNPQQINPLHIGGGWAVHPVTGELTQQNLPAADANGQQIYQFYPYQPMYIQGGYPLYHRNSSGLIDPTHITAGSSMSSSSSLHHSDFLPGQSSSSEELPRTPNQQMHLNQGLYYGSNGGLERRASVPVEQFRFEPSGTTSAPPKGLSNNNNNSKESQSESPAV